MMNQDDIIRMLGWPHSMVKHDADSLLPRIEAIIATGIAAERARLAQPEPEPVACVYKATAKSGETAHFGVYSAAKAWARSGTVEEVPIRTLKLVQKPCDSCESLARSVMLDQVYHENITKQREWVGLTLEEIFDSTHGFTRIQKDDWVATDTDIAEFAHIIEARLKEKNG